MTTQTTTNIDGINIRHPANIDKIREQAKRQDELQAAFSMVAEPDDWRKPIDAVIKDEDLGVVREAVEYFTATTVSASPCMGTVGHTHVRATGYRNGPAGP